MFDRAKFWRYSRYTVLTVALLAAFFTLYLDFRVRSEFEGRRFALPARIYARPLELHAGLRIAQIDVVRELQEAGYGQGPREGDPGWFANDNDWLEVAIRPFVFWDGLQPAKRVRVAFEGDAHALRGLKPVPEHERPYCHLEPVVVVREPARVALARALAVARLLQLAHHVDLRDAQARVQLQRPRINPRRQREPASLELAAHAEIEIQREERREERDREHRVAGVAPEFSAIEHRRILLRCGEGAVDSDEVKRAKSAGAVLRCRREATPGR